MAENNNKIIKDRKPIAKKVAKRIAVKVIPVKKEAKKITKSKDTPEKKKASRTWRKALKKNPMLEAKKIINPALRFDKHQSNPIILPNEYILWEKKAVFNPAALLDNGKVHLVYRAISHDDNSVLGYINGEDGINFDHNTKQLCYTHEKVTRKKLRKINYASGGGGEGGCEDPRLIKIEDRVYLLYTAFNGWDSVRMTISHIALSDFRQQKWNWTKPIFISPPGQLHKNWLLFPEKIKGKYAIIHSISLKIMVDYVDSLEEFDGDNFIYSIHQDSPLWALRNKLIRGIGPTPIKTEKGWLIFYHGMDPGELHKYKLYAMLLDLEDPTIVISKSKHSVLEPEEIYENSGIKPGIVYSCGAIIKDELIYIYYGAADNFICVATTPYQQFIKSLIDETDVIIYKHKKIRKNF